VSAWFDVWAEAVLGCAITFAIAAVLYFALIGAFDYRVDDWLVLVYSGFVAGMFYGRARDRSGGAA
jgi:hypothetical protein